SPLSHLWWLVHGRGTKPATVPEPRRRERPSSLPVARTKVSHQWCGPRVSDINSVPGNAVFFRGAFSARKKLYLLCSTNSMDIVPRSIPPLLYIPKRQSP